MFTSDPAITSAIEVQAPWGSKDRSAQSKRLKGGNADATSYRSHRNSDFDSRNSRGPPDFACPSFAHARDARPLACSSTGTFDLSTSGGKSMQMLSSQWRANLILVSACVLVIASKSAHSQSAEIAPQASTAGVDDLSIAVRIQGGESAAAVATAFESLRARDALDYDVIPSNGKPVDSVVAAKGWPEDTVRQKMGRLFCDINPHVCCAQPPPDQAEKIAQARGLDSFSCKTLSVSKNRTPPQSAALVDAKSYCATAEGVSPDEKRRCKFDFWNESYRLATVPETPPCAITKKKISHQLCVPRATISEILESAPVPVLSVEDSLDRTKRLTSCEGYKGSIICDRYANIDTLNDVNGGDATALIEKSPKDKDGKVEIELPIRAFIIELNLAPAKAQLILPDQNREEIVKEIRARDASSSELKEATYRDASIYLMSIPDDSLKMQADGEAGVAPELLRAALTRMGWGKISEMFSASQDVASHMPAVLLYEPYGLQSVPDFLKGKIGARVITDYSSEAKEPDVPSKDCDRIDFAKPPPMLPSDYASHAQMVASVLVGNAKSPTSDQGILAAHNRIWVGFEKNPAVVSLPNLGTKIDFLRKCLPRNELQSVNLIVNVSLLQLVGDSGRQILKWVKKRQRLLAVFSAGNSSNVPERKPKNYSRLSANECNFDPACGAASGRNALTVVGLDPSGAKIGDYSVGGPMFDVAAIGHFGKLFGQDKELRGTSFAAPVVSGLASLTIGRIFSWEGSPSSPAASDIKTRIVQSVDFSERFGVRFGRINFDRTLNLDKHEFVWANPRNPCEKVAPQPEDKDMQLNLDTALLVSNSWVDYADDPPAAKKGRLEIPGRQVLRIARTCEGGSGFDIVIAGSSDSPTPKHVRVSGIEGDSSIMVATNPERSLSTLYDFNRCMRTDDSDICEN